MDIFKVLVLIIALLLLLQLLKQHSPAQSILVSAACCVLLLFYALQSAKPIMDFVNQFSQGFSSLGLFSVLKCLAIAIIAQTTFELCKECGQTALASQVELTGRVAIMICALPLFTELLNIMARLLS